MNEALLVTFSRAGEILGVGRQTVADLVLVFGIETKPMSNGKAKGLNQDDIEFLRKRLERSPAEAVA